MSKEEEYFQPEELEKEFNTELEKCLDEQFPKGDKARGRALVLFATAQMQIDNVRAEALKEVEKIIDTKKWVMPDYNKIVTHQGNMLERHLSAVHNNQIEELKSQLKSLQNHSQQGNSKEVYDKAKNLSDTSADTNNPEVRKGEEKK